MVRNTHSQFAPLAWQHFETPRHERKALGVFFADKTRVTFTAGFSSNCHRTLHWSCSHIALPSRGWQGLKTHRTLCLYHAIPFSESVFSLRILVSRINKSLQMAALTMPATLLDPSLDAARSQLLLTTCGTLSRVREVSQSTAVGAPPRPTYSSLVIHKQTSHCRRKR